MLSASHLSSVKRVNEYIDWILTTVHSVDPIARVLIAGLAMFFETSILLGLLVPGDTVVLVSGTAIQGPVEFVSLLVAVIVGSLLGESLGFSLGKFFGPRIRHSRVGRRIGEKHWIRAETYLERRGGIAVAISRFLPIFHSLVPLVVGTSEMPYRTFLKWTAPACAVWAGLYVTIGSLAAGSYRRLEGQLHFAGFIFLGIFVVALVVIFFVRRQLERNEEKHMKHPDAAAD